MKYGISIAALLALGACAAPSADQPKTLIQASDGQYETPAIDGFYDRVFILSDAGKAAPRVVSMDEMADLLATYDVVFFGEFHGHSAIHLAQMQLLQRLYAQHPDMALSMEQFETDTQEAVDAYLRGELGEIELRQDARAWDNYTAHYRPLLEFARQKGIPVIAAEAPTPMVSCVGQYGLRALDEYPPERRKFVAKDIHADAGAYRDKFLGAGGGHGDAEESAEPSARMLRSFTAQAVRDDTMAQSIDDYLTAHPGSKVLHINGNFHSASFLGTPERLLLRHPGLKIAVINPVMVDDPAHPAATADDLATGTAIMLVQSVPAFFKDEEREMEWFRQSMRERTCDLELDEDEAS